jgi:hypothetical protein
MSHQQWWPGGRRHYQPIIVPYVQHGPDPFAADLLIVDEDTGAQLDRSPYGAFHVFLNPRIENTHGGPGRAIAILPYGQPRRTTVTSS